MDSKMTNNTYYDFGSMLISIAEYIRNCSHMPNFTILPADNMHGGSFGSATFGYTAWYIINNEEITTNWEINVIEANRHPIKQFVKGKNTAKIIEWIKEDPQRFLDELTIYIVHIT